MSNHLPHARIRTIMKSSADVESISKEALHLVGSATEMLIKHLAREAEKQSPGRKITYKDVADVLHSADRYESIREIVPKKILVRDFKKMLANAISDSGDSDSESTSTSNSGSVTMSPEPSCSK